MEAAEAATDRPRLRAPAWAGTAGEQAVPRLGYTRQGSHEVRRLDLHAEQPRALVAAAEAESGDFDLERFVGACPEDLLGDLQVLREAINDAPEVGEFEAYPPERIRSFERLPRSRAADAVHDHRPPSRDRRAGRHHDRLRARPAPAIAAQEDTSVLAPGIAATGWGSG